MNSSKLDAVLKSLINKSYLTGSTILVLIHELHNNHISNFWKWRIVFIPFIFSCRTFICSFNRHIPRVNFIFLPRSPFISSGVPRKGPRIPIVSKALNCFIFSFQHITCGTCRKFIFRTDRCILPEFFASISSSSKEFLFIGREIFLLSCCIPNRLNFCNFVSCSSSLFLFQQRISFLRWGSFVLRCWR